jgi:hypothetical protein
MKLPYFVKLLTVMLPVALSAGAQTLSLNPEKSGQVNARWDGYDAVFTPGISGLNFVGAMSDKAPGSARVAIIAFDLPELLGSNLETATLQIMLPDVGVLISSQPWFNVDVYGFTKTPSAADYHASNAPESADKVLLFDDYLTPVSKGGAVEQLDVSAFLRSVYTGPKPNVPTVYFRFNGDPASESYEPNKEKIKTADGFGRYRPFLDRSKLVLVAR